MLVIQVIACMTLSIALALALRDYILLESTRFTGTTLTLAASEQVTRDAGTMQSLAQGIFAPVAEVQIFARRRPEEPADSAALGMSERVMRFWPSHAVAVRRAILLAQSGRSAEANVLIVAVDRAFPLQCNATRLALERARAVNPHAVDELRAALSNAAGASPTCS